MRQLPADMNARLLLKKIDAYIATATVAFIVTVSVRSGVFRHNRDSVGTRGLYWHNKTSLLELTAKMTSTENMPGIKQPK